MEPTKAVYARAVIGSRTSSLSCACSLIPLLFLTAAGVGQGERAEPLREPSSCPVMSGRSHGTLRVIGSRQFRAVGPASVVAGYGVGWLSWSANGKRLVASGLGFGVRVWDADRKGEIRQLRSPADIYRPLALSPDSQRMALINPNGTVSIEAVKAGGPTRTLGSPVPPAPRPYEGSVCWSPDGKYLAAGGVDRKVTIWNAATGEKIRELAQPPGKGGEVFGVVWSPDGKHLACGARGGILQIWDLK